MNHLGGMVRMVCVEWLHKAMLMPTLCITLVESHPGTKRFEMSNVEKIQVQPLGIMGSAWII